MLPPMPVSESEIDPVASSNDSLPHTTDQSGSEPVRTVEVAGTLYTLLGTAHVSRQSADEVERLLATGEFDAVAIELDQGRFASITQPEDWAKLDLFKMLREGRAGMLMANLALGAFQKRLADQVGIEPGQEMRVAISAADKAGLPLLLVDRDIGITLRRVNAAIPWYRRLMLMSGLAASVFSNEKIEPEDIEKLKQGDILEATFSEFAQKSGEMFTPLISERDEYMAIRLLQQVRRAEQPRFRNVLVVIGAGHLKGLESSLRAEPAVAEAAERRRELEVVPPPGKAVRLIPWIIVALILTGFVLGFMRGPELGWSIVLDWIVINGGLAAVGAAIALAHPLTIVASFLAAPLTSLNPLLGVGFVAAGLELLLRKPLMGDFQSLRTDVTSARGWWRNRVARTLLVFILTTLGSASATWIAGARIAVRLSGAE